MKVHVLQHVPFEGPGSIERELVRRGARIGWTRFHESAALPDVEDLDLIVAMGGPMSVNDEAELPWLRDEKAFLARAIRSGKAVLGVCLGAQLIAHALGARVYRNPTKEIGWFPIEAVPGGAGAYRFRESLTVFHWHGETFDLPAGAVHLARSAACTNQAFQWGRRVMALQFHLEVSPESAEAMLTHCRNEIVPGPYVQEEAGLRSVGEGDYRRVNVEMARVLDHLLSPGPA